MQLEHEFDIDVQIGGATDIGPGPQGFRRFVSAAEGQVHGQRIQGTLVPGGGDWLTVGPDGYARADIRYVIQTEDGAHIYVRGNGVIEMNNATSQALSGSQTTEYTDHYVRSTFVLETGDERYAWVNTTVFVAQTKFPGGPTLRYSVERVL